MIYTVAHNGRPIGSSDLGFVRIGGPSRVGWFHPTEYGERLLPLISGPIPGVTPHRPRRRAGGLTTAREPLAPNPTTDADIAEFLQHAQAFELTLHHENGALIPTEWIGIQDADRLCALGEESMAEEEAAAAAAGDPPGPEDDPDAALIAADVEAILDAFEENDEPWKGEPAPVEFPRYQLLVELVDEREIP